MLFFFCPARFLVFPYSHLTILFSQMLVLVIFVRAMRVGIICIGERELEGYTAVGRLWKPRTSSFTPFAGLLSVAAGIALV